MAARSGPTVRRRRLGVELRRLREAAGLTAAEAAKAIRGSEAKISRMENGLVSFRAIDVSDLLHAYGITDDARREAVLALAKETRQQGWWHTYGDVVPRWFEVYVGLEAEASHIATFEMLLVPGLLQTADYARAVMQAATPLLADAEIDRAVDLRLGRQKALAADPPPQLWAILDEAAVRRVVGGPTVTRAQLAHLIEMSRRPEITIQVLPFRLGAHAGMGGSFILLGFPDGDNTPEIVYIDQATGSLYLDRPADVSQYRERMDRLRASAHDEDASRRLIVDAMEGVDDDHNP
ncbi:hypothetical protein ThrDRAFT_04723 [Frankia casuarinae]|uniref:Transcriptional regulator, XRE family n=2 Tax=Frankia casuarinae (strain DSM 45818 / CECT 9043 / HFP020203 / CcI3) TaxID=106370 RepID=Q2JC36_FRACC|nr:MULTISPECIES: helix-turn-helix transcriptional regulator [Frankia]ABD11156.1 transcriptional regulator, XRE family [Frankia casuarinae]ETA00808.1 hypothetical protein CcI6DRAFT_03749 [Frankia sp. CcI6]EYT89658.1 hypothetical protein ThrDRAFT_04723 [Frankia casuarinae]KFB03362.1 Helix-turn-helix domain [Frankia sp. Allo2]OHV51927.1 transcriptional regulator [Frankia sp. CgIS1]